MYCSLDDLTKIEPLTRIIELTDDEGTGDVHQDRVDSAIGEASCEVDSHIRGHVALPLSEPVPTIIKSITVRLSVYNLYRRRFGTNMPESIDRVYKDAKSDLGKIQSGKIKVSEEHDTGVKTFGAKTKSPKQIFTDNLMSGY